MEYVYAALLLHESDAEINEENITDVLDAAGVDVDESRVKALVAALEDVDIEEALESAAAVPSGGGAPSTTEESAPEEEAEAEEDETEETEEEAEAEEEEDVSGEGLGDLFG